ncbi:MAG TPA: prepilin-type N-terminal cleavage/methylation domain-containing protein [Phycisphaerae bacterium]|nr:prepilin-type N-terminal cleavage/methylation domain-containing protein [Phycisphaerae bacterium]
MRGFTLIEMLVVVAIIALLAAILLPALAAAREQGKRAVCLSRLQQMGRAFALYSADHRQFLPARDHFTYYIKGSKTVYHDAQGRPNESHEEKAKPINYGTLYGKYITKELHTFYCPGNVVYVYEHADYGAWSFTKPSVSLTFGGFMYGVPIESGRHPRDRQRDLYPSEYLIDWYEEWMATKSFNPLKRPLQVLVSDALIGDGYKAVHKGKGYNVLFSDLHARWISDPKGYILRLPISSGRGGAFGMYDAWDYFAARP